VNIGGDDGIGTTRLAGAIFPMQLKQLLSEPIMKKILCTLLSLLLVTTLLYGQKTITCEVNHDGKIFRMVTPDSLYNRGDTVVINLQVINHSAEKFFIYDLKKLKNKASIYKSLIFFDLVDFDPPHAHSTIPIRTLKVMDIGETYETNLIIRTNDLPDIIYGYEYVVYLGYFLYADDLVYLTKSLDPISNIKNWSDVLKLHKLHREIIFGKFQLPIMMPSEKK
jgi:hypothetical protein